MISRRLLMTAAAAPRLAAQKNQALISITIDLEMARHYPTWDQVEWDYEKGNLTAEVKRYAVEVAKRVKSRGGLIHFFAVGRVFEQADISWLQEIAQLGHPVGNHTYDHVNLRATRLDTLQPRFRRAPWLIEGRKPLDVIAENILMTSQAIRQRLGVAPAGFRSPGGFPNGIAELPQIQQLLLAQGFRWASTKYTNKVQGMPPYSPAQTPELTSAPPEEVFDSILRAQADSQPAKYPSGLIEIPMCPVSDLIAFRTGRWRLDHFLEATARTVRQTIERGEVFVFLGHPSCLSVVDPKFRTMDLICDLVARAGDRAGLVDLDTVARRVTA
jgi:peptidoglycan/xylan/chitin deacetylase (PgdA/CDA1 family)